MDHITAFLFTYGSMTIFIILLFGIVGIPAPEESFMLYVGIAVAQGSLNLYESLLFAFSGVLTGMFIAYTIGYYIGEPFLLKFGKFIGLTNKRWNKATSIFDKYKVLAIALGFLIPGIRQINPYMAGMSKMSFLPFALTATAGAGLWTTGVILTGYFLGNNIEQWIRLTPEHILIGGCFLVAVFILGAVFYVIRMRRKTGEA